MQYAEVKYTSGCKLAWESGLQLGPLTQLYVESELCPTMWWLPFSLGLQTRYPSSFSGCGERPSTKSNQASHWRGRVGVNHVATAIVSSETSPLLPQGGVDVVKRVQSSQASWRSECLWNHTQGHNPNACMRVAKTSVGNTGWSGDFFRNVICLLLACDYLRYIVLHLFRTQVMENV